ncbi:hypothetical protein PNEG_02629 [Pneumocystis murina B123]|uniref:Uncharacterized protein n=1 Tax=Pneumocystis murina (strain B123) TaxID=1069680 RepID=M7NNL6_PNEMU|nr:hypothetical protein PNEG_02629 [Pneumocystis murina B123]EMR08842.1 hypothetical protein PNEG_02629 [Pneumocystis murina B123]
MEHETKSFDEKEEYKKLFKIRDEIFMNMQATMQSSGMEFFNSNMKIKPPLIKSKSLGPQRYPQTLSKTFLKYKQLPSPSADVSLEDDRSRLERMLRARIEKRKADAKLLMEQGPSKKHIEQKTFSSQIHYKKNIKTWDEIKQNKEASNCDMIFSPSDIQKDSSPDLKHTQKLSVSKSFAYHNEESKYNETYNENNEQAIDFSSSSMAIPGLRVSAHICEENIGKSTMPTITQNVKENTRNNKVISGNSSIKSPSLSLESKLTSHDFQTYESNIQNTSRSSSFEYKPRSPTSRPHLSLLSSPKVAENIDESEKLTETKSVSESKLHYSHITKENSKIEDEAKNLKENKRIDCYTEQGDTSNSTKQHPYEPYKQITSPRPMHWKRDFYPYYQRRSTPTWHGPQNYSGHFLPRDDPSTYYQDRSYFSAHPPPSIGLHNLYTGPYDYDPYYISEFPPIRPSLSPRMTHLYPSHSIHFPHASPFHQSPSLHRYAHDKYFTPAYLPHPYLLHHSPRYDDSMTFSHDSGHFYQPSRNTCEWENLRNCDLSIEHSTSYPLSFREQYETILPYETYLHTEQSSLDTKHSINDRNNESTNWNRVR